MHWMDCCDEISINDFFEKIEDVAMLRRFALEMPYCFEEDLKDPRLVDALDVIEDFLNEAKNEDQLIRCYEKVEAALEKIEQVEMKECETEAEERMDYEIGLVVLWAATPPSYYPSPLEAARQAATHTAYYSRMAGGENMIQRQIYTLEMVGLPVSV